MILITQNEIKIRVKEMAQQIDFDYIKEDLVVLCILKGAFIFASDLIRYMNTDVVLDFIRVQSYEWEESCGEATIKQPLMDTDIHDKHILIVEDILDTGVTLKHLSMYLRLHQPLSVKTAVLLDKPARRVVEIKADYTGFEIENKFVYGYGLDYNQKYRNLPDIRTME